ncbi:Filamentous hemagglutinin [Labeo rohita]|uniref:Filamentous hemagglutinin n=1 Tax=Labeo rohita TaxID=84645 RepID=A0ABQ8LKL5_LABRO|nr:Filamentous hemagglutinin [Labeo rohita]
MPPLLPPSSDPSVTPVPRVGCGSHVLPREVFWFPHPEAAPVPEFTTERAPVPKLSPERTPVSKSNLKRDSVPKPCQEKVSVHEGSPENPVSHKCLPSHPLLPLPPPPPLSGSPSAHPQPTICVVGSTQVCQSPSTLRLEDPLSPHPASEPRTLPRPINPAALPWLLAPYSPPWPGSPLAPLGSLVPPVLPQAPPPPLVGQLESSTLSPPWLLPPSAPPPSCHLLMYSCFHLGSSLRRLHLELCSSSSSNASPQVSTHASLCCCLRHDDVPSGRGFDYYPMHLCFPNYPLYLSSCLFSSPVRGGQEYNRAQQLTDLVALLGIFPSSTQEEVAHTMSLVKQGNVTSCEQFSQFSQES